MKQDDMEKEKKKKNVLEHIWRTAIRISIRRA